MFQIDPRIKMRLDIVARYDIRCKELQVSGVRPLLLSLANNLGTAVNVICAGGEHDKTPILLVGNVFNLFLHIDRRDRVLMLFCHRMSGNQQV